MTPTATTFKIRPPRYYRSAVLVGLPLAIVLFWVLVTGPTLTVFSVVPVFLMLCCLSTVALNYAAVFIDGDVLVVRNALRTHRLTRDQVDGFERDKLFPLSRYAFIVARLPNERLRLHATVLNRRWSSNELRHDKFVDSLLDWKHGPTKH